MDTSEEACHTKLHRVRLAAGGRIVIPVEVRRELGIEEGDELLIMWGQGGYRITTHREGVRETKTLFARIKRPGAHASDELIRERRKESQQEERERTERA